MTLKKYIRKQKWSFLVIKFLQEDLILTCEIEKRNEFLNGVLYCQFSALTNNYYVNLLNYIRYKNKDRAVYIIIVDSNKISLNFNIKFTKSTRTNFSKMVAKLLQLNSEMNVVYQRLFVDTGVSV